MQHRNFTAPATPKALARPKHKPTLLGVAACANAPTVLESRTGYRTSARRADTNARTREAIRVDRIGK